MPSSWAAANEHNARPSTHTIHPIRIRIKTHQDSCFDTVTSPRPALTSGANFAFRVPTKIRTPPANAAPMLAAPSFLLTALASPTSAYEPFLLLMNECSATAMPPAKRPTPAQVAGLGFDFPEAASAACGG